jgi:hypothetical protein
MEKRRTNLGSSTFFRGTAEKPYRICDIPSEKGWALVGLKEILV